METDELHFEKMVFESDGSEDDSQNCWLWTNESSKGASVIMMRRSSLIDDARAGVSSKD